MRLNPGVLDEVIVPRLPPGKYVVGFRYLPLSEASAAGPSATF